MFAQLRPPGFDIGKAIRQSGTAENSAAGNWQAAAVEYVVQIGR
jgi:hypothetical protein